MPVETATPLRRPTRSLPFPRSKLSDSDRCVLVRTNVFNNTNYSGGTYSHAKHIWMNGIFYFLVSFSLILVFASGDWHWNGVIR